LSGFDATPDEKGEGYLAEGEQEMVLAGDARGNESVDVPENVDER
jgi:hypothetical protein